MSLDSKWVAFVPGLEPAKVHNVDQLKCYKKGTILYHITAKQWLINKAIHKNSSPMWFTLDYEHVPKEAKTLVLLDETLSSIQ